MPLDGGARRRGRCCTRARRARPSGVSAQRQRQVELAPCAASTRQRLAASGPAARSASAGRVLQGEHHLEEGRAAQVALRAAAPRPASRRAGPGARRRPASSRAPAPSSSRKVGSPDRSRAQHQRVDEEADQALGSARVRPAMGEPTHDVVLAGCSGQQHLEGGQQHHEERGALALAPAPRSARGSAARQRARAACAPR